MTALEFFQSFLQEHREKVPLRGRGLLELRRESVNRHRYIRSIMQRCSKYHAIALPKKRERKSVHSIIRIDHMPGYSNDCEPDNPSLEERENLFRDQEKLMED